MGEGTALIDASSRPWLARALSPARLGPRTLRNRIIKTATYEGMTPGGLPSPALIEHHRELARGGVGMTTVAYCAVSPHGRTFPEQMYMREEAVPLLARLVEAVHEHGAAASLQLGHCGFFSRNTELPRRTSLGPSPMLNQYGLLSGVPFSRAMTRADIDSTAREFADAAERAVRAGFDAVELHFGHGYLLSQFLSPATNHRRDEYGGSLAGRLRFPLLVLERVRERVGDRCAVIAKTNLRDGFRGGLEIDEAVEICAALAQGGIDAIELTGGFTSRTPFYLFRGKAPLAEMIQAEKSRMQRLALRLFGRKVVREYPFEEMYFLDMARRVRAAVNVPLVLLGGIVSAANLEKAMADGFDFVAMGRALIADPDLIARIEAGTAERSRCVACNKCVAESDRGGVRCVL
ncbi:MAG TPA: NADH:flavin oxidoreductase [Candidatus Limnocylindrales bacterium]|nr:NADH:flavin oxidoreductase [Candidatus Limnocylindrales bacterium]